jgi:threonine/homoserine/homoserine lactone efflux protein
VFIGIKSLRARPMPAGESNYESATRTMPPGRAFRIGFLTNALNPKVTLFFLSLFTVVIRPDTPVLVQAGYGLYMSLSTMLWFSMLSQVLGNPAVRGSFHRFGHWVERATGALLIALGVRLAFSRMQG